MAAGKPIVSTPVPDVVANWRDVVAIVAGAKGFEGVITDAFAETEAQRAERSARQERIVAGSGWDQVAEEMRGLVDAALQRQVRNGNQAGIAADG